MHIKHVTRDLDDTEHFGHFSCWYSSPGTDPPSSLSVCSYSYPSTPGAFSGKTYRLIHIVTRCGKHSMLTWKHDSLLVEYVNSGVSKRDLSHLSPKPTLELLMKLLSRVSQVVQDKPEPEARLQGVISSKRVIQTCYREKITSTLFHFTFIRQKKGFKKYQLKWAKGN